MITCGEKQAREYIAKGHIVIEVNAYVGSDGVFDLYKIADLEKMCLRELRGGTRCLQDKGHRGVCSSHVFYCDGCNRYRRGDPYRRDRESGIVYCFMCVEVDPYRTPERNPDGTYEYRSLGH